MPRARRNRADPLAAMVGEPSVVARGRGDLAVCRIDAVGEHPPGVPAAARGEKIAGAERYAKRRSFDVTVGLLQAADAGPPDTWCRQAQIQPVLRAEVLVDQRLEMPAWMAIATIEAPA